jgi:quercetin dioxygenase-like cupin family protein
MRSTSLIAAAVVAAGSLLAFTPAQAQTSAITRTDLQRHDLSIPGREVIQARVDLAPGGVAPRHSHPGEEIIYVLEGTFEYEVEGRLATLSAGEVLFIPTGVVHAARNVGSTPASELATYIVEKGKPLVIPAQ